MSLFTKSIMAIYLFGISATSFSSDLPYETPKAPTGFSWIKANAMKGTFLVPDGWHVKEELQNKANAFFITKEEITATTGFQTGISINFLKEVSSKAKLSPNEFADRMIDGMERKSGSIKKVKNKFGPFYHRAAEIITTDKLQRRIHTWQIIFANETTGSAYLITAESPDTLWNENWPVLEVITENLGIDDSI